MFYAWKSIIPALLRRPFSAPRLRQIDVGENPRFEPVLHCLDCGACCQARDGTILIVDQDLEKWKKDGYGWIIEHLEPGHFGQLAFKMTPAHRCVFQGTDESPYACRIYGHRATICRSFEMGCPQCFDIRRNRAEFQR